MGYKNDDFEKFMSGESLFGSDRSKTNSDYDRSEDYDFSDSSHLLRIFLRTLLIVRIGILPLNVMCLHPCPDTTAGTADG